LAERCDHAFAPPLAWAEVDEEHLVVAMVDQFTKHMPAIGEVNRSELALENRVLKMVPKITHGFEDFAEAFVIADVVAD
jgi:hypothetical protein